VSRARTSPSFWRLRSASHLPKRGHSGNAWTGSGWLGVHRTRSRLEPGCWFPPNASDLPACARGSSTNGPRLSYNPAVSAPSRSTDSLQRKPQVLKLPMGAQDLHLDGSQRMASRLRDLGQPFGALVLGSAGTPPGCVRSWRCLETSARQSARRSFYRQGRTGLPACFTDGTSCRQRQFFTGFGRCGQCPLARVEP